MTASATASGTPSPSAPPSGAFSLSVPGLQIFWDSTSLGEFKRCPRSYYYRIVLGYAPRGESIHLTFGILYHGALERYDHARSAGRDHQQALRACLRWLLESTYNPDLGRYWASGDNNKNLQTLLRSVIWYADQFQDDPLETIILANGKPAVELSFRFATDYRSAEGTPFHLCGHLDRLVRLQGEPMVADRKTTGHTLDQRYFTQYAPDNQMSTYALASQVALQIPAQGIIIDAAQIAVGFTRFMRQPIPRPQSVLEEWYEDLGEWLAQAERFARLERWPMNDKSCFGCAYRGICSQAPSSRAEWLANGFTKRIWDPTVQRGDI